MAERNTGSSRTQGEGAQSQDQIRQRGERQQRGASRALQRRSAPAMIGAFGVSPFSFVRRLMEDMDRVWEGFGGPATRSLPEAWSPPIETFGREGRFVLRAELPGLSPNDVRIEVEDGALILEGERKSELESEEKGVWRSERYYGRFSRAIALPDGAEADKAEARFENGVLEVSVPLRDDASRRRRIGIQGSSTGSSSVH